jgi:hypothetical protein
MKKVILALIAIAFSASALAADPSGADVPPIKNADTSSVDSMRMYLPQTEGVDVLYDTYIKNGYQPLDAVMLASWDVTEAFRVVRPNLPENPGMKAQVEQARQKYKPAK